MTSRRASGIFEKSAVTSKMPPRPYRITSPRQLRALASAARQDIIDAVAGSGPTTIAELADRLGRPADALYHHVRQLVKCGLLIEGAGERGIGRPGGRIDVPGRPMLIHYDPSSTSNARTMTRVLSAMLGSAKRGFARAFVPGLAVVSGPRRNLWAARYQCWLTPADLEEVNVLLARLGAILINGGKRRTGQSRLHEFTYVISPIPASDRAAKPLR